MAGRRGNGRSVREHCAEFIAVALARSARATRRLFPARTLDAQREKMRDAERFRRVTEHSLDLICETTIDGRYVYASPNYLQILGYRPAELIGLSVFEFCHEDERAALLTEFVRSFVQLDKGRATFRYRAKSGEWHWFEGVGRAFLSRDGPRAIVIKRDITGPKAAEERIRRLEELASLDARTGVLNRGSIIDRLRSVLRDADQHEAPVAVFVCSLDRFSLIRDKGGRAFADELLRLAGARLRSVLRAGDTLGIVDDSRYVVVAPSVHDGSEAAALAERCLEVVRKPFQIEGSDVSGTISVGIALHPTDGTTASALLDAAELAANRAKHAGRDRFCWATAPDRHGRFRHIHEAELRRAIAVDEFVLHYQPIVDARTEKLEAFEALVRWMHPSHGLVAPDAFIPLAERSGLVVDLGLLVLRRACAQLREWRSVGLVVPRISINVSPQQVWRDDLVDRIADALAGNGLTGADVEIELTETTAMGDVEAIKPFFRQLRALGVQIGNR